MPWQTYSEWKGEGSNESGVKKNSSPGAKKEVKEAKERKTDKELKEENTGKVGNDGLLVDFAKLSSTGEVSTFTPEEARENTIKEMNSNVDLTRFLEKGGISCCLVAECALFRYKSRKTTIYDWIMCVPQELHDKAKNLITSRSEVYKATMPRIPFQTVRMHCLFPRYSCVALGIFFVLTTSQATHIQCTPENIEHSPMGLPYPKLAIYAQSLVDTQNVADLDELVDSQDLTLEWGRQNLALDGEADWNWGYWRVQQLDEVGSSIADWRLNARSRRELWENAIRGKKRRQDAKDKERAKYEKWATSEHGKAAGDAMLRGDMGMSRALYEEYKVQVGLD